MSRWRYFETVWRRSLPPTQTLLNRSVWQWRKQRLRPDWKKLSRTVVFTMQPRNEDQAMSCTTKTELCATTYRMTLHENIALFSDTGQWVIFSMHLIYRITSGPQYSKKMVENLRRIENLEECKIPIIVSAVNCFPNNMRYMLKKN